MSIMRNPVTGTQSLERSCDLLRQIAMHGSFGASLATLSRQVGWPHPTTHRILQGLVRTGLAHFRATSKRYRIGPLAFELGLLAVTPLEQLSCYRSGIEDVARRTGDTAYLMALRNNEIVCLINQVGSHQITANVIEVGARRPMCDSVAGIALLAAMGGSEANLVLDRSLELPAVSTRLDRASVLEKIRETVERGIAYWSGVVIPGVAGAAIAIPGLSYPHLAIAISTVDSRLPESRLPEIKPILQSAAEQLAIIYQVQRDDK